MSSIGNEKKVGVPRYLSSPHPYSVIPAGDERGSIRKKSPLA
jgi:hypothetical protein